MKNDLRTRIGALKKGAKDTEVTRRLFEALEAYDVAEDANKTKAAELEKQVKQRLDRLRRSKGLFDSGQQRDLLVIVLFGERKIHADLRLDACALLKLSGTDEVVQRVCTAYPGFRRVFEE